MRNLFFEYSLQKYIYSFKHKEARLKNKYLPYILAFLKLSYLAEISFVFHRNSISIIIETVIKS